MNVRLYLPAFLLALCTSTLAATSSVPATVVVAFNRTKLLSNNVTSGGKGSSAYSETVQWFYPCRHGSLQRPTPESFDQRV